ncbi:hypothetical protein HK102_010629, partial [Quaeritorhiza haematococci]
LVLNGIEFFHDFTPLLEVRLPNLKELAVNTDDGEYYWNEDWTRAEARLFFSSLSSVDFGSTFWSYGGGLNTTQYQKQEQCLQFLNSIPFVHCWQAMREFSEFIEPMVQGPDWNRIQAELDAVKRRMGISPEEAAIVQAHTGIPVVYITQVGLRKAQKLS